MAIILAVLGVSGASIDTLVLHVVARNAHILSHPIHEVLLLVICPMRLPMQHRSLSCQVSKIHYMYIPLIAIINRMSYFLFASATCIHPD